ncbi:MAG: hypothetical protein U1F06_08450 [Steroidobacteraceae bacterium]
MAAPAALARMPAALRRAAWGVVLALWLSGTALLALQLLVRVPGEFGPTPHPLEPATRTLHGVLALATLYLLGWLSARHVGAGWQAARRRATGTLLLGSLALLVASGFALYFVTADAARGLAARAHDVVGVAALLPALLHWLRRRG